MSLRPAAALAAFSALAAPPAAADDVLTSANGIVRNFLCVGAGCTNPEIYNDDVFKLKTTVLRILFDDTSTSPGFPANDWRLTANDVQLNGQNHFAIEDATAGRKILRLQAGAPANSVFVDPQGRVGFGTTAPTERMHIVTGNSPLLRLERNGSEGNSPKTWIIGGNLDDNFIIRNPDRPANTVAISAEAPHHSLRIDPNGNVGIGGGFEPQVQLDIYGFSGEGQVRVTELDPTTSPRTLLHLLNRGRPEIVMSNMTTNGEWSFGAGTNFVLKQGAMGTTSDAKFKAFEIDPAGNATLTGTLTTGGTTCGTGCDRVFAPDYPLPSIADHAAAMRALGYLPNVGPTPEGAPVDVTDKLGRMLNELEHAHLYIAELEERDSTNEARIARLESLVSALLIRD